MFLTRMRRSRLLPCISSIALAVVLASGPLDAQPSPPSGPLASGLAALAASDYAKAESELVQVKGAAEAEARIALGRAALEQGKYEQAEKHAQAAAASPAGKTAERLNGAAIDSTGSVLSGSACLTGSVCTCWM